MVGRDVDLLNLLVQRSNGSEYILWTKRFSQGNKWIQAFADLQFDEPNYKLVLEAYKGDSYLGDIALDDFEFREGACPDKRQFVAFECTFDRDE